MINNIKEYLSINIIRNIGYATLGILIFIVIWALIMLTIDEQNLLSEFAPLEAFISFADIVTHKELLSHVVASLKRIVVGMSFAIAVGIPLGFLLGTIKIFELTSTGVFQFLRMISPLSWTPLAIILFGVGKYQDRDLAGYTTRNPDWNKTCSRIGLDHSCTSRNVGSRFGFRILHFRYKR